MIRTTLSICALFGCLVLLSGLLVQSSAPVRITENEPQPAQQRQATPVKPKLPTDERFSVLVDMSQEPQTFSVLVEERCAVHADLAAQEQAEVGTVALVASEEVVEDTAGTDDATGEAKLLPSLTEQEDAAGRGRLLDPVAKPAKDIVPSNPMRGMKKETAISSKSEPKRSPELVAMRGGRRFGLGGGQDSESKEKDKVGAAPTDPNQEAGPVPSFPDGVEAELSTTEEEGELATEETEKPTEEMTEEAPAEESAKEETPEAPTQAAEKTKEPKAAGEPTLAKGSGKGTGPTPAAKPQDAVGSEAEESASEEAKDSEESTNGTLTPVGPEKPTLKSADEPEPLTIELVELQDRLHDALAYYYQRPENVATRSPWGSMHAMLAYGVDSELIAGNRKVNAIGWLCYNGTCNGQRLFFTDRGNLQAQIGPGVQGHAGQFLSMLAQSRVQTDYPIRVDGQNFTVANLIEYEKLTCKPKTELTFKLIALSHYLQSEETWLSQDRQEWNVSRLIKEELAQPIVGAACGGTHRLTGLSYAVKKRKQRGETIEGQWQRADTFIQDFHEYTFRLQNPDGSFSTEWFKGRGDNGPPSRRLETTGHITEWLAFSLSDKELRDPKMVKSVSYLTNLLLANRVSEKWSIGPLGHGLHALAMYDERVFGNKPGMRKQELAGRRLTIDRK